MRKVIISGITLFCLLLSFFTVRAGMPLFKIPAIKEVKQKYDETTVALGELKKFQETAYKPAEKSLAESVTNYKATRELYEKIAETKTDEEKEKAFKSQAYDLEYLWIKIGNYAYENKADLTLEIYKTDEHETDDEYVLCDLKFKTISSYSGAKAFIEQISTDSELQFIPENLKMTSEWKEINVLTDADKTRPLVLDENNNRNASVNNSGMGLRKLLLVTEFYKSNVPVSKATLLKIENTQTVEAEKNATNTTNTTNATNSVNKVNNTANTSNTSNSAK